ALRATCPIERVSIFVTPSEEVYTLYHTTESRRREEGNPEVDVEQRNSIMVRTCSSSQEDRQVIGISLNEVSLLEAEAEGNESEQVICQVTSLSQLLSAISLSSHNPPTRILCPLP